MAWKKDMKNKCINHYIGQTCNNKANPKNSVTDACGKPLTYCDECFKIKEKPEIEEELSKNKNDWYFFQDTNIFTGMFTYCKKCGQDNEVNIGWSK